MPEKNLPQLTIRPLPPEGHQLYTRWGFEISNDGEAAKVSVQLGADIDLSNHWDQYTEFQQRSNRYLAWPNGDRTRELWKDEKAVLYFAELVRGPNEPTLDWTFSYWRDGSAQRMTASWAQATDGGDVSTSPHLVFEVRFISAPPSAVPPARCKVLLGNADVRLEEVAG